VARWAALLAGLLAGCATAPPAVQPGAPMWITGRLIVKVEATDTQAAQGANAAFELRGNADGGELNLNSPLGTRMVSARWARGSAVLSTPQGERSFANLDDLSRHALGESLPLAALPDWLLGRPWPQVQHEVQATGFEQLGWQINLQRLAEGWVEARRHTPPAVSLRARIDTP
jgi:outer membrane lipoprotein LolB